MEQRKITSLFIADDDAARRRYHSHPRSLGPRALLMTDEKVVLRFRDGRTERATLDADRCRRARSLTVTRDDGGDRPRCPFSELKAVFFPHMRRGRAARAGRGMHDRGRVQRWRSHPRHRALQPRAQRLLSLPARSEQKRPHLCCQLGDRFDRSREAVSCRRLRGHGCR